MSNAYDDDLLEAVRTAIEPYDPGTPEQLVEERISRLVEEMIELTMLAVDPEQRPLLNAQWRGIAQILLRAQLILGSLEGKDVEAIRRLIVALTDTTKPHLKVVSRG